MFNSKKIALLKEVIEDLTSHKHCARCKEVMLPKRYGHTYDKNGKPVCDNCIQQIGLNHINKKGI